MRPYDEDWRPRPDSFGRKRVRHAPTRLWDFPAGEEEYRQLLDALLDAADPWQECVVVFTVFIEPDGSRHVMAELDRIDDTIIPFSPDGGVCFEAGERSSMLQLLVAHQRSHADILVLPDHRRQRLKISHHDVVHVEFEDAKDIPGFVSVMRLSGFGLPEAVPDWTFRPQAWLTNEGIAIEQPPFAFAEGEAIVPWPESPRTGVSRTCRLEHPEQLRAWREYWWWTSHVFRYPNTPGQLGPFLEQLLKGLEPWKEVLVVWDPRATDECLRFLNKECSDLVEWLERCSGEDAFELIPDHGREFLLFYPKHRRVDGVFSEPARLQHCVALVARTGARQLGEQV